MGAELQDQKATIPLESERDKKKGGGKQRDGKKRREGKEGGRERERGRERQKETERDREREHCLCLSCHYTAGLHYGTTAENRVHLPLTCLAVTVLEHAHTNTHTHTHLHTHTPLCKEQREQSSYLLPYVASNDTTVHSTHCVCVCVRERACTHAPYYSSLTSCFSSSPSLALYSPPLHHHHPHPPKLPASSLQQKHRDFKRPAGISLPLFTFLSSILQHTQPQRNRLCLEGRHELR